MLFIVEKDLTVTERFRWRVTGTKNMDRTIHQPGIRDKAFNTPAHRIGGLVL